MNGIVEKRGPFEFDHVALGVRDTRKGADWLASRTGARVVMTEPEEGQWYWSAVLPLPDGAMLEVLGPNPAHRGFHLLKAILGEYETPAPVFWHLATGDFDRFRAVAKAAGSPVERVERLDNDSPHGRRTYTRGIVGPGFRTTRPCVIQWIARPDRPGFRGEPECRVVDFSLTSPKAADLNRTFEAFALELRATEGPECLSIRLDTPNGEIGFSGPGLVLEGFGALSRYLRLRLLHASGG